MSIKKSATQILQASGEWYYNIMNMLYEHESGFKVTKEFVQDYGIEGVMQELDAFLQENPIMKPKVVKYADLTPFKVVPPEGKIPDKTKYKVTQAWLPGDGFVVVPKKLSKKMQSEFMHGLMDAVQSHMTKGIGGVDVQYAWESILEVGPFNKGVPLEVIREYATVEVSEKLTKYRDKYVEAKDHIVDLQHQLLGALSQRDKLHAALSEAGVLHDKQVEVDMAAIGELTDQVQTALSLLKEFRGLAKSLINRFGQLGHLSAVEDYVKLFKMLDENASKLDKTP